MVADNSVLEVKTEDDLQYKFYPVSCGSVQFSVRASKDAHIALTTGPEESSPIIEVIIGGWENTKSVIRKNKEKIEKAEVKTTNILNANEFRNFYIRWDGGLISVGRGNEEIMSWEDNEPFPIAFVGVCTGWGATGTWKIEEGAEFNTPNRLEYKFGPVAAGYLEVDYRGPHDAHICLTSSQGDAEPIYEIILGGWKNTQSVIRYNKQKPDKMAVPTPGLMFPNEFKKFLISWHCGRVVVRERVGDGPVIMEWTDRAPFPVRFFGVRTAWGARGSWRIQRYFKSPVFSEDLKLPVEPSYPAPPPKVTPLNPGVWVDAAGGQLPPGSMGGGQDITGEPMYVARAKHQNLWIPGKLVASHKRAYVPWNGKEHSKPEYQVLVGGSNHWVPAKGKNIPSNAFPAGENEGKEKETLYIGRVEYMNSVTIGKVHQSHGKCYIPFDGKEISFDEYEILVM